MDAINWADWEEETEHTPKERVIGLLSQVMGQSPHEVYDWEDQVSPGRVRDYCERQGIRWGKLLEMDTERACSGLMPEFFLEHWVWADFYRVSHHIQYMPPQSSFVPGTRTLRPIGDYVVSAESSFLKVPRRMGWACPAEQAFFYRSEEWKRCASAYRYLDGYECRICRSRNKTLHVHHRMPILSAYHHNFHLNFAWWKLESVCQDCHADLHKRTIRSTFDYSYVFVGPEEVLQEKKWLRQVFRKHHQDGACKWCELHVQTDSQDVVFEKPTVRA